MLRNTSNRRVRARMTSRPDASVLVIDLDIGSALSWRNASEFEVGLVDLDACADVLSCLVNF